jgi:hypothetical protein
LVTKIDQGRADRVSVGCGKKGGHETCDIHVILILIIVVDFVIILICEVNLFVLF